MGFRARATILKARAHRSVDPKFSALMLQSPQGGKSAQEPKSPQVRPWLPKKRREFMVSGFSGSGFRASGLGSGDQGSKLLNIGFGLWVWGFGFRIKFSRRMDGQFKIIPTCS